MNSIQQIADRRAKFLDGLDANEGAIKLDIFEDFYPDQAHFVFELLQNAEDVRATHVRFLLSPDGCVFEHNGTRTFDIDDVDAITGVSNSTKSKQSDQIGKFGVGFKSVFVYTSTPVIYSGGFSFRISRYVKPELVEQDTTLGNRTRFWLPFNNPKKPPVNAHSEIERGLGALAETTLLFLSHIESVKWQVGADHTYEIVRRKISDHHFETSKETNGQATTSSHFLRFEERVAGLGQQRVAIAYALDFLPSVQRYDSKKSLAKQLRIVPALPGQVAVYFPAEKETSGLRFHLHAPFVPELSRASIKQTPVNDPLFQQLASLTAASLHHIRDLGLLTREFLGVLPNPKDSIPSRYASIRATVIQEMNSQSLTPTDGKSHAPARYLCQAKATLKSLLSTDDLEFLIGRDYEQPQWAIAATQNNDNVDRFLDGLAIRAWDVDKFVELVIEQSTEKMRSIPSSPHYAQSTDVSFMKWLSEKSLDWHQELYALLFEHLSNSDWRRVQLLNKLRPAAIIRRSDGAYGIAQECFFPADGVDPDRALPRVHSGSYTSGRNKAQQQNARKFLEELGVREVGEAEQVEAILRQRYTREAEIPDQVTYRNDLKRFVRWVSEDKASRPSVFADYFIFEGQDGKWHTPSGIFLDHPYMDTGLSIYYEKLPGTKAVALADEYAECGIAPKDLAMFAAAAGAQKQLSILSGTCQSNPDWNQLSSVGGDRHTSPINRDYTIAGIGELLDKPTLEIARLLWRTMSSLPAQPNYLQATYQRNERWGSHHSDSQLVHHLRKSGWIPQGNGIFVRPENALRDLLPEDFTFAPSWPWLKAIQFGASQARQSDAQHQKQAIARQLGFADGESLDRAKRFAALPAVEQERILAHQEWMATAELPEHISSNPERRAERVAEQATNAPDRRSEERSRSVSVGVESVKENAAQYLRQQYTHADEGMICQLCKGPLPFKLDDGKAYFEKVEFLPALKKRHYQNYLALCPNHAAMFQHANRSSDLIQDMFVALTGNELEVVLAQTVFTIYFTKTHISDLKAVIRADSSMQADGSEGGA